MTVNLHRDRPAPPPLEYDLPPCSLCGQHVECDGDYFTCPRCGCFWPETTAHVYDGKWDDPDLKQCGATKVADDRTYRCSLTQDHGGELHVAVDRLFNETWPVRRRSEVAR